MEAPSAKLDIYEGYGRAAGLDGAHLTSTQLKTYQSGIFYIVIHCQAEVRH